MTFRRSPTATLAALGQRPAGLLALGLLAALAAVEACGAGSSLDDYAEGVPEVVPEPIKSLPDGGGPGRDAGSGRDAGRDAGGASGGAAGGAAGGGGSSQVGGACMTAANCADRGAECLTTFTVPIINTPITFTGGYCTISGCMSDTDCPSGSGCNTLAGSCLKKCARTSECRATQNYTCAAPPLGGGTAGAATYCLPTDLTSLIGGVGSLFGGAGGTTGAGGFIAGILFGTENPGGSEPSLD